MLLVLFLSILLPYYVQSTCPNIISRAEWDAKRPTATTHLTVKPATYIVIHHTDTPSCNTVKTCKSRVKSIQHDHMTNRHWSDIGYNFLIGGDGNIYEGRGWGLTGAHLPGYNSKSVGISLIGKFHNQKPSSVQLDTLKSLIACAEETDRVSNSYHLIGHRQGKFTTCPGDKLFSEISTYPHFDAGVRP